MLTCFFNSRSPLEKWVAAGAPMPCGIEFKYFGGGERPRKRPEFEIANKEQYQKHIVKCEYSPTLFADTCWTRVSLFDQVPSDITIYDYNEKKDRHIEHAKAILRHFANLGAYFGAACRWDEWSERHLLKWGNGNSAPVGKDTMKYVPGLYYATYISDAYAQERGVDLAFISQELSAEIEPWPSGKYIQLYRHADDWAEANEKISAFLAANSAFFGIRRLFHPDQLPADLSWPERFQRVSEITRDWR